jgi:putative DNA primase/helicase
MTKFVPIEYDEDAACPTWLTFLGRVMRDNATLIAYLQMAVGYALTGSTGEQCFFLLHGIGANGKTTFVETIQALAGDYGTSTDFRTFIESKNDRGPRDDVAELFGARLVTAVEVGEGKRFNESLVKSLTGSDTVRARFLYESAFQFKPQFKLFLAANHKPVIRGTDEGIWRRVRLIPFTVQIPKSEQDKELLAKLREELPGILAWAVQGCQLWLEHGLGLPDEVRAAGDDYRAESDTLGAFIDEYCELGDEYATPSKDLYDAYAQWAKEGGEFQLSQTAFGRRLEERGITSDKRGTGALRKVWRIGIRLVVRPSGNRSSANAPASDNDGDDQEPMLFSGDRR